MLPDSLAGWLERLEQLHPKDIDMGLERVARVASRLKLVRPAPRVFTVTGTNGKGSTCAALEALLRQAGLRTGLYTSPHLLNYNERVLINGQDASDQQLCEAFTAIEQARAEISLTYFEFGTLAALLLFQRAGLDAVVLEVGLGGRLDAVNIIDPDIAVVTSIGLDHQEFLGDTRDSVGFEKAGILRPGIPLVCSETDLPQRFSAEIERQQVRLFLRGQQYGWAGVGEGWAISGIDGQGAARQVADLPAVSLPRDNLATALQAFWAADLELSEGQIADALARLTVVGRLQRRVISWRGQPRRLMLDVGHNPHAAAYLAATLSARSTDRVVIDRVTPDRVTPDRVAVFGLLADKDLAGITTPLVGIFSHWFVAPLPSPRTRSADDLAMRLTAMGERAETHASVAQALEQSLENTPASTEIIIFGSFFCVSAAILWLNQQARDLNDG